MRCEYTIVARTKVIYAFLRQFIIINSLPFESIVVVISGVAVVEVVVGDGGWAGGVRWAMRDVESGFLPATRLVSCFHETDYLKFIDI